MGVSWFFRPQCTKDVPPCADRGMHFQPALQASFFFSQVISYSQCFREDGFFSPQHSRMAPAQTTKAVNVPFKASFSPYMFLWPFSSSFSGRCPSPENDIDTIMGREFFCDWKVEYLFRRNALSMSSLFL